jgi:Lrp/AsnC family transcriptional regulator
MATADTMIKVVVEDMRAYDDFLRFRLLDSELVSDVQSRIVVSTVNESTELALAEG